VNKRRDITTAAHRHNQCQAIHENRKRSHTTKAKSKNQKRTEAITKANGLSVAANLIEESLGISGKISATAA
jgi:hypothetical protein